MERIAANPQRKSKRTSMSESLVSVIVPIYNAEPYLEQCLNSIINQTHKSIEIILLNDGSTDKSLSIMQRYAAQDGRIKIIDKQNQGYGATCNRGLMEATGTWISIVEPDDWIEPNMYSDMIAFDAKFAAKGTPLDIVKTPYWRIWMPDTKNQRKFNCSYKNRIHPLKQPFAIAEAAHLLCHHPSIWSAIYRKSFLTEHNIRFKEIPGAGWADNPFLIETLCQTNRIGYFDKAYYCYREETPEKSKNFARSNTLLPLERWNDMMDILERLNITDERILRAHNSRGFTYLSGILEEVDLTHDNVRHAAKQMFERMDADLVLSDDEVSPGMKHLFADLRGIPCPSINPIPHIKGLIKQGLYFLKNTGASNTLYVTKSYITKKRRREGQ